MGGPAGASAALEIIITRARVEADTRQAIFGQVHCRHCGSAEPADWIESAKGTKTRYKVDLNFPSQKFLKGPLVGGFLLATRCWPGSSFCHRSPRLYMYMLHSAGGASREGAGQADRGRGAPGGQRQGCALLR